MEIQKLIEYLRIKKKEAIEKGYFLHGIMERDGIVVVDFKTKTFSPAQGDGDCFTLSETMDNLTLLGYKYDNGPESPASRWWNDFIEIEPEPVEASPDVKANTLRAIALYGDLPKL